MDPPSAPTAPKSGEDLTRAFRNLPPGTLAGLDALCDHSYWSSVMRQAEIEISNEDIFRFRFFEISKTASNRLAFLAGSGEYGTFNLRYLIQQLVEQCSDMHKYTRKLEKYVVKLQRQVEDLEAAQRSRQGREAPGLGAGGPGAPGPAAGGSGGGGGGGSFGGDGNGGSAGAGGGSRAGGYLYPPPRGAVAPSGGHHMPQVPHGGKRPRSPPAGSVEAAGAGFATGAAGREEDEDDE